MARLARLVVPGFPHHVTQRGNRNQQVFFNEEDYAFYLELVAASVRRAGTEVWAYCLMPNHVHLVMVPQDEDGLRAALGDAHRRYTQRINQRQAWQGHLWQERFHSFVMDEAHLLEAVRYIELNPVRAGLSRKPEAWRWSSARAHLDGKDDALVRVAPMLELVADWRGFLGKPSDPSPTDLLERHESTGRPLGDSDFIARLERVTGRKLKPGKPGRKKAE